MPLLYHAYVYLEFLILACTIYILAPDKAFWARGYYVETIGNITDEAVQKYIKEQAEESRREDSRSTAL